MYDSSPQVPRGKWSFFGRPRSDNGVLVHFVVDGGSVLGYGHIGRCLALLEELGGAGTFEVDDAEAAAYLVERGAAVSALTGEDVVLIDKAVPTDAENVLALQASGHSVCLLDDLGSGRRRADLVVDPPTAASWPAAGRRRLAGFEHALIRAELRGVRPDAAEPAKVLLGLGGSDPLHLTAPLADALESAGFLVEVALGPGYRGPPLRSSNVLESHREWPAALGRATVVVTGYGHSLLEAAYLGVPAVAVVAFATQLKHALAFAENGTAVAVDAIAGVDADEVVRVVALLLDDPDHGKTMADRGLQLVDGRGAARVARALRELA